MLTTITLGGHLGQKFGRDWRLDLDVPSPAEAVRALCAVCKGFRAWVLQHDRPGYHVLVGERDLGAEQLRDPTGRGTIHIMPALVGAVDKSVWQIIAGGVLIAGGVVVGVLTHWTGLGLGVAKVMISAGVSLSLGGVSQLLAGAPPAADPDGAGMASYIFSGPANTSGVGHPVPVIYGQLEIGSQVISAGINGTSKVSDPIAYDDPDPDPPIVRWHNPRPLDP